MSKFKRKLVTCDPIMPDKVLEPYVDIVAEVNLVENSKFKHGPVLVKVVDGRIVDWIDGDLVSLWWLLSGEDLDFISQWLIERNIFIAKLCSCKHIHASRFLACHLADILEDEEE